MKLFTCILALGISFQSFSQNTWTVSNTGISTTRQRDMAVGPNGNVYLVGYTYDYIYSRYYIDLFKTVNQGSIWTSLNVGSTVIDKPTSIIFSGNTLLICGEINGNYYVSASSNFGQNWTSSNSGIPSNYELIDFAVAFNGDVFIAAAINNGFGVYLPRLLRSTDIGATWNVVPMTGLTTNFRPSGLFIDSQGKMYLAGEGLNLMHVSSTYGLTWTSSNTGIPTTYRVYEMAAGNGQEIYASCLELNNNSTYDQRIIKSTNSGATWLIASAAGLSTLGLDGSALVNSAGNLLLMGSSPDYVYKSRLPTAPAILTFTVDDVEATTANGFGQVTGTGNATPVFRGFCWNTLPNPSIANFKLAAGIGTGTFAATITGLLPSTTYYAKAYATNSAGTAYGREIIFTTTIASGIKSFDSKKLSAIYPIPSSDFIYLDASVKKTTYTIYDMFGKLVLTAVLEQGTNAIDITSLSKGCYFLQAENGENRKILKQ